MNLDRNNDNNKAQPDGRVGRCAVAANGRLLTASQNDLSDYVINNVLFSHVSSLLCPNPNHSLETRRLSLLQLPLLLVRPSGYSMTVPPRSSRNQP